MATSLSSVTAREGAKLVQRAAQLCLDMKANDVVVLNLAGVTDLTDYFVIASGTSATHVRSIGEHVISEMKKAGLTVHHTEGLQQGRWVLLDFFDFVVHIFHPTLRSFYQIERLWSDAETVALEPQEKASNESGSDSRHARRTASRRSPRGAAVLRTEPGAIQAFRLAGHRDR